MKTTLHNEQPLRICVVFDENSSARSAEVLITHVASDYKCDTQLFSFEELDGPKPGVAAARRAADTDILMLAARGDRMLPAHIRMWLGLCLGMRDEGKDGALVALITEVTGTIDLHSSILEYLETIAIIGGLAFFPRRKGGRITLHAGHEKSLTHDKRVQASAARGKNRGDPITIVHGGSA